MVQDGQISADEAAKLLAALERGVESKQETIATPESTKAQWINGYG